MNTTRAMLTAKGSPMTTSMYRDMMAGNEVEAEQIIGDLFRRAQMHGLASPLLGAANVHLSLYQKGRAG